MLRGMNHAIHADADATLCAGPGDTASNSATRDHDGAEDPATAFARDGYYVARGLFRDQIPQLTRDFDRICAQVDATGEDSNARWRSAASDAVNAGNLIVQHTHQVHFYSEAWMRLWFSAAFLDLAECFLGPDLILHHTKLFRKPAEIGAAFPTHQDWPYFPTERDHCIAAIVHVSDATDEMGCLRLHPGSHRAGRIADGHGWGDVGEVQRRYPLATARVIAASAGDVVFFHCHTVHGSPPNRSPRERKTVLAQLYAGDDRLEQDRPGSYDARLVLRGWNQRMTRSRADH